MTLGRSAFRGFQLGFERCKGRFPEGVFVLFRLDSTGAKECKSERSRKELSNEQLLAKIGCDTAENEPSKVCQELDSSID